ncbi:MAG: symmetrical bis(5'-nucleosyl)-tetraphosphatase [Gammaproteobacteria bacterium]|nr:symmetrical bis(5'-nucleosyl)-tetraphosphatase [Gammaproteobacteria bacterium]MDH5801160.1 symmetrical bis(5'-nucleosyl)-tetraphosphatase [Gammaproteobacteria bacterium]
MAIYAIGDVQGCYQPLMELLRKLDFTPTKDTLWFTGDLVNRGPESLAVLEFVKDLGDSAVTVLGNHDLHLLAVACGQSRKRRDDTLDDILASDRRRELLNWLRHRPLLHRDVALGFTMIHAGLAPQWSLPQAEKLAQEVEQVLRSERHEEFFQHMYGDQPLQWHDGLKQWERLRFITNCLTRLRYSDMDGRLCLSSKGPVGTQPERCHPWFQIPHRNSRAEQVVFGHWSTLGYYHHDGVIGLDSGCLWGGALTAVRLDHPDPPVTRVQLDCPQAQTPVGAA